MPSNYPSTYISPTSSPHNRFRDHSPTKSSPLRHTVSTRSNNSDTDHSSIPSRQGTISSNASSGYTLESYGGSEVAGDPFVTRSSVKRERSESPVKKNAAFAKWEEREQAEQTVKSVRFSEKMDISPRKIRDDDWRSVIGKNESRSVLQPVAQNASRDRSLPTPTSSSYKKQELKENVDSPPDNTDGFQSPHLAYHSRGHSMDDNMRPASPEPAQASNALNRNSMATLSRADSIRSGPRPPRPQGHLRFTSSDTSNPHLDEEDLDQLQKSSTPQLRHLSKLASQEGGTEELTVHSPDEQVVGLAGRRRLQRSGSVKPNAKKQSNFASQYSSTKWMDTQRKHIQAYEYLCHIGEARAWIEDVLEPTKLPPIVQLEEALRDGVTLAELVVRLAPSLEPGQCRALGSQKIFRHDRLQYRHSDNIALFFRFVTEVQLPELFRFELVDLYEKKNIPKVIYCIHALSWLLFRKGIVQFRIGNLVGQLHFEDHELEETQKGIDRSGVQMPNFGGMREAMQVEEEPPAEPTPEELLVEQEDMIMDLQSQVRGAFVRLRLGDQMQDLWDAEDRIAALQALIRGKFAREIFDFRFGMDFSTRIFQAAGKAFLVRRRIQSKQAAWEGNQDAVVKMQSLWRGRQQRAQTRTIKSQLRSHQHGLKEIQAAIRGALSRWRAGDVWHETRDETTETTVVELQAALRGALARMRIGDTMNYLWDNEDSITELQAIIRGVRQRKSAATQKNAARHASADVVKLQAVARGLIQRRQQNREHGERKMHEREVVQAQALARGLIERLRQARTQGALQGRESGIVKLQALLRGHAKRCHHSGEKVELSTQSQLVSSLQALVRGNVVRQQISETKQQLNTHGTRILDLQSLVRGLLARQNIGQQFAALEDLEPVIISLQSLARANLERQRIFEKLVAMEREDESITQLQALARAMLLRCRVGDTLADLDEQEAEVVELQAALRGFAIRRQFTQKRKHYHENMQKVIKLQSFVRAKQQGESYRSLVNGKNPPLPVVRRHLHLLTDSNLEFEAELEAERLRKQFVESVRENEEVERYVDQLDVKIALVIKNKITLDEVVKHQRHFGGSASQLLRSRGTLSTGSNLDLKALNKTSRKKLTSYEELFFLLQTQPQYLARLSNQLSARGISDGDGKNLERIVLTIFSYAQKSREEYLFLKVLNASMQEKISRCQTLEDYLRLQSGAFHQRLLTGYVKSPRERAYLKTLLGSTVKSRICGNDHLDLENDPQAIYRAMLNDEELSTGRPSQRPRDLPKDVLIRQDDVRSRYVAHLQDLRDIGEGFFQNMEESLHRMPYIVRYLAAEQYNALCAQFSQEDPAHLATIVGAWLWRSYIHPALREPEMWGVVDRGLSPDHKRNLNHVVTAVAQVMSVGRPFGQDNVYLQPLNTWVKESLERWHMCLSRMFDNSTPEVHYDADQFSDLYARTKPTLSIKMSDIFALHSIIADNVSAIAPARDDPIRELLSDLGTAKSNESDLGSATNGGEITLTLKSRFAVQEDPNAEARQLFTATKRLILYIIRVQSGSNLMEILLRPITHEDADRWISLVEDELAEKDKDHRNPKRHTRFDSRNASIRGARTQSVYSEAPSTLSDDRRDLLDLQSMTYAELKSTALENILMLEQSDCPVQYRVTRANYYQEILNAIAADIRQKHLRRLARQREIESTRAALAQLDAKAAFLEDKLKSYHHYIETSMQTLASKKGRTKFLLPFTKQWSHERELERTGRQPKFGSYKYSAKQLAEKGVLLSWAGYAPEHWGQLNVVLSSDDVGVFHLEASSGSMMLPGASANLLLDELLQAQYDNKGSIAVFEESAGGGARMAVNLLLHLVFKKFYRDE